MKLRFILAFVLLGSAAAQSFTTVTGTVTDPNGLPYANGTIATTIVISNTPFFAGTQTQYFQPSQPSGLDGNGKFLLRLADVTQLTPGGATYTFTVCSFQGTVLPSFGKGSRCFTVTGVSISGTSQDISTTLNAAALTLTANFGTSSSVSGSGTANTVAMWTGTNSLGNSPLTVNGNLISLPATGSWQNYHGQTSLGNGMAQVVGLAQGSSFINNISPITILTSVPASGHQFYRINCYLVVIAAATTSGTLPQCQASWTDANTSVVETATFSPTNSANTVGSFVQGTIFINPSPGTAITVSSTGYASVGGSALTYVDGFNLESL